MHHKRDKPVLAIALSVALHVVALMLATQYGFRLPERVDTPPSDGQVVIVEFLPPPEAAAQPPRAAPAVLPPPRTQAITPDIPVANDDPAPVAQTERAPVTLEAPPAPSAEEWAFAARYPLKNSKAYRYTWGQQVRSLMGTAVEGPDQGVVRFRVEIAPDGTMTRLETLWTTSAVAEQLARQAMARMPPSPPTPTGKPLIFEKTISFSPFVTDIPPIYKDDCLPDPPSFANRFAWNGQGQPGQATQAMETEATPDATEPMSQDDCLKLLPQDAIEAETAHDQRQLDRWGSSKLGH
ncbi:MAG: energy transducer TonB [Gammaproteobacteria bacterium]